MDKKKILIISSVIGAVVLGVLLYVFIFRKDLAGRVILPYITHQTGRVDPHVPSAVPLADKLDELMFEGLFNVSANPSGITYEDGLGELVGMDDNGIVTVRLKPNRKWHRSYKTELVDGEVTVTPESDVFFEARDLKFTLDRIRQFGSLSPDYILVSQAIPNFDFAGPDENNEIRFKFKGDRIWSPTDIKEILSFKILPHTADAAAGDYADGTGPYMRAGSYEDVRYYQLNPALDAGIPQVQLKPYIDNSTYVTELKNRNINALLGTPFGEIATILADTSDYFYKSSIATSFFTVLFNTERLNREQRRALRSILDNRKIMERFFKIGTPQQRHIANYKGDADNYDDYLNSSVFPTSSYYVSEQIVAPVADTAAYDLSVLPDTVRIRTCVNYQFREELSELVDILNAPEVTGGRIRATAVTNDEIAAGNYDAVLVPVSGYRSNFLFDLYSVFLREPDFAASRIHLQSGTDRRGNPVADPATFTADKNFMRLDATEEDEDAETARQLLEHMYGFMSSSEIGDKQVYAQMVDAEVQDLALGTWLFSLPSLAYFSTQFDKGTIDLYGTASQLSTVENWREQE